jgi:neutral amino acid transport system permease protein
MTNATENATEPDFQDDGVEADVTDVETEKARLRKRALVMTAAVIIGFAVMWVVATVMTGTIPTIFASVLRSAIEPQTAAVAIAVIGLNIHFGFTGLLNIGQAGFMLLGAYGFAIAITRDVPLLFAVLVGLGAAAVFALLLGIPTLKLRGDYLAIVTISAAEIIRYTGRLSQLTEWTGGSQGLPGSQYRDPFVNLSFFGEGTTTIGPFSYQNTGVNGWWIRFVAWLLVGLCCILVYFLVRSPWGRLLRGIREDEEAMRSLGKNVFAVKMQALIIGGALGALGGIMYVLPSSVQADSMGRSLTFFIWTALLLGGAATIFGPVLGTILFFAVRILIRGITGAVVPPEILNTQQSDQFSWVVVGVILMLLVIFRPQGILGNKRELQFNA